MAIPLFEDRSRCGWAGPEVTVDFDGNRPLKYVNRDDEAKDLIHPQGDTFNAGEEGRIQLRRGDRGKIGPRARGETGANYGLDGGDLVIGDGRGVLPAPRIATTPGVVRRE